MPNAVTADRPSPNPSRFRSTRPIIGALTLAALLPLASSAIAATVLGTVSPATVDFGPVKMGATASVPVTVHNITGATVGIASGGISAEGFSLDGAGCAGAGYQLTPDASCQFVVSFTPDNTGGSTFTAAFAMLLSSAAGTQTAIVHFSGRGSEHLAQVSPVGIDFGTSFIGQHVSVPVTITNTHAAPLTFNGGGVSDNRFSADSGNCPSSLPPGQSCSFNYGFTASDTATAQTSTSIGIVTQSPSPMQEYFGVALEGHGTSTLPVPNVAVWPLTFDLGSIVVGQESSVYVSYKNNGAQSVYTAGGGFNDDEGGTFEGFSTNVGGCATSEVPSGAQCATQYRFLPHAAQAYSDSTGITFSDASGHTLDSSIAVTGIGVGILARVSPRATDLSAVPFDARASIPVTITNTSTSALTNFTGGSVNRPFALSSGCGASLAVGASCTLTYTFYAPSSTASVQSRYVATTLLSFTNATGIQPVVQISLAASVGDRIFGDGFDG